MSEYMEKHTVSRLIGAPPGYVGYEEGGLLIDAIRKSPHAVLLLDEIEKAHPDLFAILLQVMDHATLTDTHGRKADFRHVILIMTTNAGARDLSGRKMGFSEPGQGAQIHRHSRTDVRAGVPQPARRDRALQAAGRRARSRKVVDKHVDELRALVVDRGITIELTPEARAWLAENGLRSRVRRAPDGAAGRAHDQEAAVRAAAVRRLDRRLDDRGRAHGERHIARASPSRP